MGRFPIASCQRAWRGRGDVAEAAASRQKCRCEVTVFDADEILSTLPKARGPFVQTVQFLRKECGDFPAFAVVRLDRVHPSGVRHRQIAEVAKPGKPRFNRIGVELDGRFRADHVSVIKLEMLADFQMAIAPSESNSS